ASIWLPSPVQKALRCKSKSAFGSGGRKHLTRQAQNHRRPFNLCCTIFRLSVFRCTPNTVAAFVWFPPVLVSAFWMNLFSNSLTASSRYIRFSIISETNDSNLSFTGFLFQHRPSAATKFRRTILQFEGPSYTTTTAAA